MTDARELPRRRFGASGVEVSVVGQGTWQMERTPKDAGRALRRGVELGMNHVDTAEIYGDGRVEELVGAAIEGLRDEVFLVSKIRPDRARPGEAERACAASLARLRTDRLDTYLLHWLPPHPLEEAVEAMEGLVQRGMIRHWGVSNFDETRLEEITGLAGTHRIVCNQVLYHLGERAVEHAVLPLCRRNGMALVGYSPFAVGQFPPASSDRRALDEIAEAHGATPRQVALAFLIREPETFTIPKASSPEHVEDNAAAARVRLVADELTRLKRAFPLAPHRGGVPMW